MKKIFTKNKEEKTKEGTIASLVSSSNDIAVKLVTELVISEEVENAGSQSETKEWKDIHEDFTPELQKDWGKKGFNYEDTKKWIEVGLEVEDADYAEWIRDTKGKSAAWVLNYGNQEELAEEYQKYLENKFNAQEWLESQEEYNTKEKREKVTKLDINDKLDDITLEGNLDLSDFVNLRELNLEVMLYWNNWNNLYSLNLDNCPQLEKINCCYNWLTKLDVINCTQLKELYCSNNLLISITLPTNTTSLKALSLWNNCFPRQDLSFLARYTNLEKLTLGTTDEQKINQGIYNYFIGSLDYLSNMKKLKYLGISNTDLDEVDTDKLPDSLEDIYYFTKERPECRLKQLVPQLWTYEWKDIHSDFTLKKRRGWEKKGFDKRQTKNWIKSGFEPDDYDIVGEWIKAGAESNDYEFITWLRDVKNYEPKWVLNNKNSKGYQELREKCNKDSWCRQCQQPNTGENWCQPCFKKEWQEDLKKLTGQEMVEKFIQQQPGKEQIQWIPYEQFKNIEYLAEGGFSKIFKSEWSDAPGWNGGPLSLWHIKDGQWKRATGSEVVLKILTNSQNVALEFLTEIANTKMVDSKEHSGWITKCYGISQDPETGNYVMVMEYMHNGNLRQYLTKNYSDLDFHEKLGKLADISEGLNDIHKSGLAHRDFHSGNILNNYSGASYITDLGLSQPASYQKQDGRIFGVLPYMAPEVLRGKPYTQAADIYSLGIIAYELFANSYPYPELDNTDLALKVCQGLRPNIDEVLIPQLLKDLIKRCWDIDQKIRPSAEDLHKVISNWSYDISEKKDTEFYLQYQEIEEEYNTFSQNTPYQIHPTVILSSKPINTKPIAQQLERLEIGEEYHARALEKLTLDNFDLDIQEDPQEQSSTQAQIQIPPKK